MPGEICGLKRQYIYCIDSQINEIFRILTNERYNAPYLVALVGKITINRGVARGF